LFAGFSAMALFVKRAEKNGHVDLVDEVNYCGKAKNLNIQAREQSFLN
jgi:hypothetical protein